MSPASKKSVPIVAAPATKAAPAQPGKAAPAQPGKAAPVGKVTMAQCREIAEKKIKGMNARDLDAAAREIAGSARSMGLEVVE